MTSLLIFVACAMLGYFLARWQREQREFERQLREAERQRDLVMMQLLLVGVGFYLGVMAAKKANNSLVAPRRKDEESTGQVH